MRRSWWITVLAAVVSTTRLFAGDHVCDAGGPCSSCLRRGTGDGTLFRWSSCLSDAGGPDLNAPLVTDRPDFTEASSTVGVGVAQWEVGYTFVTDDDGTRELDVHSWGEPLLRYGIFREWLELRLAVIPATEHRRTASQSTTQSGFSDLYLGFKIGLTPQAGFLPEMGLIPQMFVPSGSSALTADEVLPGLNWLYSWDLSDELTVGGSTQFNRRRPNAESFTLWAQSATVSYSLTDRVGAYTEWFGLFPHSADTESPQHYVNGGLTYLLTNDFQLDIRAGMGLNDAAEDFFCGAGFAWRIR